YGSLALRAISSRFLGPCCFIVLRIVTFSPSRRETIRCTLSKYSSGLIVLKESPNNAATTVLFKLFGVESLPSITGKHGGGQSTATLQYIAWTTICVTDDWEVNRVREKERHVTTLRVF